MTNATEDERDIGKRNALDVHGSLASVQRRFHCMLPGMGNASIHTVCNGAHRCDKRRKFRDLADSSTFLCCKSSKLRSRVLGLAKIERYPNPHQLAEQTL